MQFRSPDSTNRSTEVAGEHRRSLPVRMLRLLIGLILGYYVVCTVLLVLLTWFDPPTTGVQMQRRVESWFHRGVYTKRETFVPLSRMSVNLRWAVVAAEDGRFYHHNGVDWNAVEDAIEERETRGRVRGGSTITQQLAKNLFLVTYSSYIRKAFELPLAYLTDLILTKRRILELYLNVVEWGPGVYGAEEASRYHYHKSAARLSREEAARLAACLPDPLRRRPQRMNRLARSIMRRMAQLGH